MKEMIKNINNINVPIYVVGHKNADMDSLCSSLALVMALVKIGKKAKALIEDSYLERIKYFDCNEYITNKVNEKEYAIIIVDVNRVSRLTETNEKIYNNAIKKLNIDHHEGNLTQADCILSIGNISSTCEIIYNLINKMNILLDKKMAELLITGIFTDTNLYTDRVTSNTFLVVSKLMKLKINYDYLIYEYYLKVTLNEMDFISKMIKKIKYAKFHYIILDITKNECRDIDYETISKKCIPYIKNIEEIKLLIVFIKYKDKTKGEIRSKCNINASLLAKELTGGGHKDAAGFSNTKSIKENIKIIQKYIEAHNE
jgi:phosphoesterase RecJ-like protein